MRGGARKVARQRALSSGETNCVSCTVHHTQNPEFCSPVHTDMSAEDPVSAVELAALVRRYLHDHHYTRSVCVCV